MRCGTCGADKPPAAFTNSQKKKRAGARTCSACGRAPSNVALAGADTGAGVGAVGAVGPTAPSQPAAVIASGSSAEALVSPPGVATPTATVPPGSPASAPQPAGATADAGADPSASAAASLKFCAWAGCGRQLPVDPAECSKCSRCKQAFCCGRRCQKGYWSRGGHREACAEPPCCTICLDGGDDPVPIQRGHGCRGDAGLAHAACRAEAAARKAGGVHVGWKTCPTCGQAYTGAMALGLARGLASRLSTRRRDDPQRLAAGENLGSALREAGGVSESADVLAGVLAAAKRVLGKEHPGTLTAGANLANTYYDQGKVAEAAELRRAGGLRQAGG